MLKDQKSLGSILTSAALILISLFVVFSFISFAFEHKVKSINQSGIPSYYTADQRMKQLDCLAINIYKEAGYEPFEGKVAVAQVTINRANHPDFPKDICQVVYQKNHFFSKTVCQFSWYCDTAHKNRPVNPSAYNESYEVAKKVLLENFRLAGMKDALYYHADYVNPKWNKPKVGKIGRHIFYKENNPA